MTVDLAAAHDFMTTHARLIDRCRFDLVTGASGPERALVALEAYRNADGGYGWALEPDLRAPESQPVGAMHAFEVFAECAPATSPRPGELCDWLATAAAPDGGIPFVLPMADPTGCSPVWTEADPTASSLHLTAAVAAYAHRVARHEPAVREHPLLKSATRFCLDRIAALDGPGHAIALRFCLWFLDALAESSPEAAAQLERLAGFLPASATLHVEGGAPDEAMRPLDFSPLPDTPLRSLLAADTIAADLERLAGEQRADGGWDIDFVSASPAAALEWRGYATVEAVTILRAHGIVG